MNSYNNYHSGPNPQNMDPGTWQPPTSRSTSGQGAICYTGAPQRYYNFNQTRPENRASRSSESSLSHASHETNAGMSNYTYDRSRSRSSFEGQNPTNSYYNDYNSDYSSAPVFNNLSYQNDTVSSGYNSNSYYHNFNYSSQDSSYNTSGNINAMMGQTATNSTDTLGLSGYQNSNYDEIRSNEIGMPLGNGRGGFGRCAIDNNVGMINDEGENKISGRNNVDDSKISGYVHKESDVIEASVHCNHFQNPNLSSCSRGHHHRMRRADFRGGHRMRSCNFGWRGCGSSSLSRMEPYHVNNRHNFITLNARHQNQWGYRRKYFNKNDDELVEHLFEIHDSFCTKCQKREEGKLMKRKIGNTNSQDKLDPNEEHIDEDDTEEELTEEELQMRDLMGFSGFQSRKFPDTKRSRVKDGMDGTVSSVNQSKSGLEESSTSTLTEEERRKISSIGGYSVFSKRSSDKTPEFGAPAVTMEPSENQKQNDSSTSECTDKQAKSENVR